MGVRLQPFALAVANKVYLQVSGDTTCDLQTDGCPHATRGWLKDALPLPQNERLCRQGLNSASLVLSVLWPYRSGSPFIQVSAVKRPLERGLEKLSGGPDCAQSVCNLVIGRVFVDR